MSNPDVTNSLLSAPTDILEEVLKVLIHWRDVDMTKVQMAPRYDTPEDRARATAHISEQVKLIPLIEDELNRRKTPN